MLPRKAPLDRMLFGGGAPAASKQGEKPRPREAKARLAKATRRRTTKMPRARGCVRGKNAFPFPALGYPCLRPVLHLWGVCETTLFWSIRSVDATHVGATSSLLVLDDLVMRCRRFASDFRLAAGLTHTCPQLQPTTKQATKGCWTGGIKPGPPAASAKQEAGHHIDKGPLPSSPLSNQRSSQQHRYRAVVIDRPRRRRRRSSRRPRALHLAAATQGMFDRLIGVSSVWFDHAAPAPTSPSTHRPPPQLSFSGSNPEHNTGKPASEQYQSN